MDWISALSLFSRIAQAAPHLLTEAVSVVQGALHTDPPQSAFVSNGSMPDTSADNPPSPPKVGDVVTIAGTQFRLASL